jgi:O-antigen/teichoic acid export membrane protein
VLISHTLKYLPAQLLSPLAQLASMILWTHWLSPQEMGVFTLVSVTQELAYLGCLGWFAIYALRYLPPASNVSERLRYLATENSVVLAALAASAAAAAVTAAFLPDGRDWAPTAAVIAAFFGTKALSAHYADRARAQSSFLTYSVLQVAGPVGGLLLGWLALQHLAPTATVLLGAYAVAQALGVLLALPGLGISWRLPAPDRALLRAAWAFGGPVLGLSALGWAAENYIRYLVQWHSGAAALGLMVVGWSLGRRCAAVASTLVTTASFPLAARMLNENRRDEALGHLRLNAAMMVGVLMPVTVAIEVLGPALVNLFVASEYRAVTTEVLALSMLAGAIRNLHMHTTDQLMVLERRIGMLAKVDLFEIVLCAGFSLLGLLGWGLPGAVFGQALGSLATLALSMALARRYLGFSWPWRDTFRVSMACAVMLGALWLLPASVAAAGVPGLAVAVLGGAVVYGLTLALMYASELRMLWSARRGPRMLKGA